MLKKCLASVISMLCLTVSAPLYADPAPVPIPGGTVLRNLPYGDAKESANRLDLYLPQNAGDKPLPLIVWIHGGGWEAGDKSNCPAAEGIRYGYVVASLNYRFSRQAIFPAQIHDCKGAIRWLRANAKKYHIDTQHIAAWGDSAGGHLAALLGTTGGDATLEGNVGGNLDQSSRVQAVIDWYGPTDLVRLWTDAIETGRFSVQDNPLTRLLGGPVTQKRELAISASPVHYVTKDTAPFLIMHGDRDDLVPLSQSQQLLDVLKKTGVAAELIAIPGAGHGGSAFFSEKCKTRLLAFLDQTLKGTAAR